MFPVMFSEATRRSVVRLRGVVAGCIAYAWVLLISMPPEAVLATEIDLGCLRQEEKASADATICNNGSKSLKITRVTVSCGCVATSSVPNLLPPGKEAKFKIQVNARQPGHIRQHVLIEAEDDLGTIKSYRFDIVGVVNGAWSDEDIVDFGIYVKNKTSRRELTIYVSGEQSNEAPELTFGDLPLKTRLLSTSDETLRSASITAYRYEVLLEPQEKIKERINGGIDVMLRGSTAPMRIPVKGNPSGRCACNPATLFLGRLEPGKTVTKKITVTRLESDVSFNEMELVRSSKNIEITSHAVNNSSIVLEVTYTAPPVGTYDAVDKGSIKGRVGEDLLFDVTYISVKKQ